MAGVVARYAVCSRGPLRTAACLSRRPAASSLLPRPATATTLCRHIHTTAASSLLPRPATATTLCRHIHTAAHAHFSVRTAGEEKQQLRVREALLNSEMDCVDLTWSSGEVTQFPYVWLRDSCRCEQCFHPTARNRILSIDLLDVNIEPQTVQNDRDTEEVVITWPDDHVSRFPHCWLHERIFTPRRLKERRKTRAGLKVVFWDRATIESNLFKVDYHDLLGDLSALDQTLHQLITFGVLVVQNSPTRFGVVEEIGARLGHNRLTHYGRTFRVASKMAANNVAYTSETLSPHLDAPYYGYVPGVQMLHCISQHTGSGGENTLTDSFYIAELIRQRRPDLFQLLCTMPLEFDDVGVESESHDDCRFHKVQEHRVFRTDHEGNVNQVCFSNHHRSYRMNVPLDLVKPMYEGLKMFHDLSVHKTNHALYKMVNGDVLVFDNHRVTHGRLGFTVTEDSSRTLEGGYVDWDEILCRYRSVCDQLHRQTADS